jgi:hypothetical protein
MVLAARGATNAAGEGRGRPLRVALIALVLIAGLATSRAAYRELRGAKRGYHRMVSATASLTSPGDFVLTNVWWFDQVAASLHGSRVFLYAGNRSSARQALAELAGARIHQARLIWTEEEGAESLDGATAGTCFDVVSIEQIPERSLRVASARCRSR